MREPRRRRRREADLDASWLADACQSAGGSLVTGPHMPGMDGLAALREITADPTPAGTRVVADSTGCPRARLRSWLVGAAGWLAEPFDNLFKLDGHKENVAVNYGLAAVVYAVVGGFIARLLRR